MPRLHFSKSRSAALTISSRPPYESATTRVKSPPFVFSSSAAISFCSFSERSVRRPMTLNATPFSTSSLSFDFMKWERSFMSPETSSSERFQFSVENA